MSEYVFAYILAFERNIFETYENQKNRLWQDMPYKSLKGTLLGICGLGSIGRHIALTGKHFGMDVWGYKRSNEDVSEVERLFTQASFREFLAHPDYVVITLPHTPESFHLFDDGAFQANEPGRFEERHNGENQHPIGEGIADEAAQAGEGAHGNVLFRWSFFEGLMRSDGNYNRTNDVTTQP
jgi:hypothetical protein